VYDLASDLTWRKLSGESCRDMKGLDIGKRVCLRGFPSEGRQKSATVERIPGVSVLHAVETSAWLTRPKLTLAPAMCGVD
jgi:hypothetical protein